jgi:hypothetical protein
LVGRLNHEGRDEEMRNVHTIFVGKPQGNKLLEKPKRKMENNIKMDHRGMVCLVLGWLELIQYKV